MKAAFVVMSILGCDDSGVHCQPVASVAQEWQTIAACDAASEKQLTKFRNINFPTVVAVCQTAGTTALVDSQADSIENSFDPATTSTPPPVKDKPGLTARALALVKGAIPTKKGITSTLVIPVHFVAGTYSWVVRKVAD